MTFRRYLIRHRGLASSRSTCRCVGREPGYFRPNQYGNLRAPSSAGLNNPNQPGVYKVKNSVADVPSLEAALVTQLLVDANHERLFARRNQVDVLPCKSEPIPEGDRETGCASG